MWFGNLQHLAEHLGNIEINREILFCKGIPASPENLNSNPKAVAIFDNNFRHHSDGCDFLKNPFVAPTFRFVTSRKTKTKQKRSVQ